MLLGRVGKDVEVKDVNGTKCAIFTIATSEKYKDRNGEYQENTQWHNVVAWRNVADICERFVKKGDQIGIEGRLQTRNYTNSEGRKIYVTEIIVENFEFLQTKRQEEQPTEQPKFEELDPFSNDLPFQL